ncbi:MAG: GNAT family N-acetyltransferase [Nanoarchaeota archaeon]
MERNAESERLKELMKTALREMFPLFSESHRVDAGFLEPTKFWIRYQTSSNLDFTSTQCDLNIWGDICYALHRQIEPSQRGKGLGWMLYEAVHSFARAAGCRVVRCTPSGGPIINGRRTESRRDYLLRRGYIPFSDVEVELVL